MGRQGRVEPEVQLAGDVLGDELGGGVHALGERGHFVEVVVVEGGDDLHEDVVDGVEVADKAVVVELVGGDACGDAPVVAVERLDLPGDAEGVCGGELGMDGDFVHTYRV